MCRIRSLFCHNGLQKSATIRFMFRERFEECEWGWEDGLRITFSSIKTAPAKIGRKYLMQTGLGD
jgi:hypothetical protein